MKHTSIWNEYREKNKEEKEITNNTDILIIGGGITGLTTAYYLKDTNKKIMLIDKSNIGSGITLKTTAKITYLQQDIYSKLINMHGKTISKKYYDSQKEAINEILKIIKDNNIECDLEQVDSVLFTTNNINKLNKEKNILSSYGEKIDNYKDNFIKHGFIVNNTYIGGSPKESDFSEASLSTL